MKTSADDLGASLGTTAELDGGRIRIEAESVVEGEDVAGVAGKPRG
jgi:hypothetical protein